ncbi:hypothetical protein [Zunongwangia endophytica]|uniref:Uncharacterized protein n=1 Tax=Zunongwangia endophytica TaxID=1808945 RepID=A0ABV8HHP1_9FLAO|nr:hypothetical protein [Zunongwangia endophytica]MDN3593964.1 hypothetical protein [Zunongwangia endophytica]
MKSEERQEKEINSDPKFERLKRIKEKEGINTSFIYNNYHNLISKRAFLFHRKLKLQKYFMATSHLFLMFLNIIAVLFKITLWLFFFFFTAAGMLVIFYPLEYNLDFYKPFFINNTSTIISISLWCAIIYAMISRTKEDKSKSSIITIQIIPLIFLIFLSITIYQKGKAEKTLNHKTYDVQFGYDGRNIKSSAKRVFVGKTTDYIFLRDVENHQNYIFPLSRVNNLQIIKITP